MSAALETHPREDGPPAPKLNSDQKAQLADQNLLTILRGYKAEAKQARESGTEARQDVWEKNIDSFWMRRDDYEGTNKKMDWQARERAPYVSGFVERFTSAIRQALTQVEEWASVQDPRDKGGPTSQLATRFTRLMLDTSGTNATGQPKAFESTFGSTVRAGCLTAMCAAVTWRDGRLRIELVDPRSFYPDHTGRGLYRIRTFEKDKSQLLEMAEQLDGEGEPLYDIEAIKAEMVNVDFDLQQDKEKSSGGGAEQSSVRKPMYVDEYLATIVGDDGEALTEKRLIVVLNERTIIRNEPNPFWHGQDWIVYHPLLQAPFGEVDGRTYVEDFRPLAETLENCTNMILDAIRMNSMNAFEIYPELLQDPSALDDGLYPNMAIFRDADESDDRQAIRTIELGRHLGPETFQTWQALKGEMQEAGSQSDLSLGHTVSSGETTATEANLATSGQNSLVGSIASDIEDGFLAPILLLAYYTGIQHLDENSHPEIVAGLTPEQLQMLLVQRQEFRNRTMTFRAKGISSMLERAQRLRGSLGALNVIGGNPMLVQAFQAEGYSIGKYVTSILQDFDVDTESIKMTPQEQQDALAKSKLQEMQQMQPPPQAGGAGPTGGAPGGGPTAQNMGGPDPLSAGDGIDKNV